LVVNKSEDLNAAEPVVVEEEEEEKVVDLNIKNLKVVELKSKSVLSWDSLEDALSYNVYRELEN
jgi:hypothetical protein